MGLLFAWLAGYIVSLWVCGIIHLATGKTSILGALIISLVLAGGFCSAYGAIKAKE